MSLTQFIIGEYYCQNYFIELRRNYLIGKMEYDQSMKQIIEILLQISPIEHLTRRFRAFFHIQLQLEELSQCIDPLMKTVR